MDIKESKISDKIIKNTTYNIIGRFWVILIAVFLTPYIITRIGIERYGIWAITGAITGYVGLFELGIGKSFAKYVSEFFAKHEYENINKIINTGLLLYIIFALFSVAISLSVAGFLPIILKIPSYLHTEAVFVFALGIITFGISNLLSPFGEIQSGLQRMDIRMRVNMFISVPNVLGTVFFLETGHGLPGLMINNAIIILLAGAINIVIDFKLLPQLRINPFSLNTSSFKRLFLYSYKLQISRLAQLICFQFDKILIAYFLKIDFVAFYELGSKIAGMVREALLLIVSALIPASSEIETLQKKDTLDKLYIKSSKYLLLAGMPLLFFTISNAPLIIASWVGTGCEKAVPVIQILLIGYFANLTTGGASAIAAGIGKTEFEMKYGIFMAALNIVLSIALITLIGFIGCAIGTSIAMTLASLFFLKLFHNYLRKPLKEFFSLFYKPLIASAIALAASHLFDIVIKLIINLPINRVAFLSLLTSNAIFFCILYILIILRIDYLDANGKKLVIHSILYLKNLLKMDF